ncbi:Hypothetical predicted protein [Scomber scombrus]|uniref:Uncharacterized protein n=1 Tax=Scomber scombrus TaxID=13677 RepID=A0AAV1NFI3_SCOSC
MFLLRRCARWMKLPIRCRNYRAAMFQPGEELQNHNHTLNWTDCILQCLTLVLFIHKRHSFLNHKLDHT